MKSEPAVFSFDDLKAKPGSTDHWEGVRNYQARNYMREMRKGDLVLFYHSNCETPGVVGIAEVVREAYLDHTAFEPMSIYYDPKSKPDNPRWFMVEVKWKRSVFANGHTPRNEEYTSTGRNEVVAEGTAPFSHARHKRGVRKDPQPGDGEVNKKN